MDKAIADKWVAALRSGNYQQTSGRLKDDKGHCCLGVLCEVLEYNPEKDDDGNYWYNSEKSVLSEEARQRAGMKSNIGELPTNVSKFCLTELNDSGKSFNDIATVIEDNWEVL